MAPILELSGIPHRGVGKNHHWSVGIPHRGVRTPHRSVGKNHHWSVGTPHPGVGATRCGVGIPRWSVGPHLTVRRVRSAPRSNQLTNFIFFDFRAGTEVRARFQVEIDRIWLSETIAEVPIHCAQTGGVKI